MCLQASHYRAKRAKHDIYVIKFLKPLLNVKRGDHEYVTPHVYKPIRLNKSYTHKRDYVYMSLPFRYNYISNGAYHAFIHDPIRLLYFSKECVPFIAYIPKGAYYYKGMYDDICSPCMFITDIKYKNNFQLLKLKIKSWLGIKKDKKYQWNGFIP